MNKRLDRLCAAGGTPWLTRGACATAVLSLMLGLMPTPVWAVTLTWGTPLLNTDGTPPVVDSYTVYRSMDGGITFTPLQTVPSTILTLNDPEPPNGTVCYQVTARNLKGDGPASNRMCFQVPTAPPGPPADLH